MSRPAPALEDRLLLDDLSASYLWALDTGDVDLFLAAFWPDATLRETQLDGSVVVRTGLAEIEGFTTNFADWVGHQHREANRLYLPGPDLGADAWHARSYWFTSDRDAAGGGVAFSSTGYYRDVVRKSGGEWRFAERWIERWPADAVHPYRTT